MGALEWSQGPRQEFRRALTEFVADAIDADVYGITVDKSWPETARPQMAFVMPQETYSVENGAANGGRGAVNYRVVLVGPQAPWADAHDWLDFFSGILIDAFYEAHRDGVKIGVHRSPIVNETDIARFGDQAKILGMNIDLSPVVLNRTEQ